MQFVTEVALRCTFVKHTPGLTALSASDDGTLILWDVATGQPIRRYTGHNGPVRRVVFSRDGRSAISADSDEIIEWRIETLEELVEWTYANRHVQPLTCLQREQYNVRPLCNEMETTPTPTPTPTVEPTAFLRAEVVVSSANVRATPDPNAAIITSLSQGTVVDILEIIPEWYKIVLPDGREGWIARELVTRQ